MARENRFFLLSSELAGCAPMTVGGRPVGAHYAEFIDRLESLCGREAAELFAEPMLPRGGAAASSAVSWYGPCEGRPVELDTIDAVARKPIADRLGERLASLAPAFADAQLAEPILAALNVTSSRDVVAVGGEPILVNWGYLPQDVAPDAAQRLDHFNRTLGRYAPLLTPLVARALGVASDAEAQSSPAPAATPAATASAGPVSPAPLPRETLRPAQPEMAPVETVPAWRAPLIASAVAAALLLIFLLPGVLAYPNFGEQAARDEFEAQRLRASNQSLEAQLRAMRKATDENVCRADNSAPVPEMGDPTKPAPKMDLLPKPPDKAALPVKPGEPAPAATVAQLLEKSVVYVFVVEKEDKVATGSGFFISPTQVVTNRHVIEDALDEQFIFVASKTLNGARRARVTAKTPSKQVNGGPQDDFAVLELARPAEVEALKLGPSPQKLSTAYIAGYPGFLVDHDSNQDKFIEGLKEALKHGETDEELAARRFNVPSVDLRYGRINNVMSSGVRETPIIVHDMQVAHGNSGGPLIDGCGRVAGVNSLFFADEHQVGNVALSVVALRQFLTELHIAFAADDQPCGPTAEARPEPQPTVPPTSKK